MEPRRVNWKNIFRFSVKDFFTTLALFLPAIAVCSVLRYTNSGDGFASPVFVLVVLLVSRFTDGYFRWFGRFCIC